MKNIVFFGDSILARLGKPYISSIEEGLPAVRVHNCAAGGFDSSDGLTRISFLIHLPADLFVLSFGMNDCAPWKCVPLDVYKRNCESIVRSIGASRCLFLLPPPVDESLQAGPVIRKNDELNMYRDEIIELATRIGFRCVDVRNDLAELTQRGTPIHGIDGVHPSDNANEVVLNRLISAISTSFDSPQVPVSQ